MALNRGWAYRSEIGPEFAGQGLLRYLADSYTHSGSHEWAARLARGEVTLDGRLAAGDEVLRAGQVCVWNRAPWDEPDVPRFFDVIHEDAALLVVNKPSGLPTMPAGGFLEHTLWALVRGHFPGASPVHRLGRFTSGLVLFARTRGAASALTRALRDRDVEKDYLAIGSGEPAWDRLAISAPIGPVPHAPLGYVYGVSPAGKPASTVARVIETRGATTLFDVRIMTGRPHQIRIHLAWAGHPLAGDPLYVSGGVPGPDSRSLPGDGGYWLHAHRLRFAHPVSGEMVSFDAPPMEPLRRS
jgi:23S rRNA pseudouridine1911/1915/1917 synthase